MDNNEEKDLIPAGTSLPAINTRGLKEESLILLNQIISESDAAKVRDLTYLFNVNQNKKTLVRLDNLSDLQDLLVGQFSKRMTERPDEISNQELMTGLKVVHDLLERGQAMVTDAKEAPLIQINQQTNSVNVGAEGTGGLNRESRERVKNFLLDTLSKAGLTKVTGDIVLDATDASQTTNDEDNSDGQY